MGRFGFGIAAACLMSAVPVLAAPSQSYSIPAQDMASALEAFAAASGREVLAGSEVIAGKRANEVRGELSAEEALSRLLAGTGLRYEIVEGAFVIKLADAPEQPPGTAASLPIVVTGTRIPGTGIASPRITLRTDDLKSQGLATLTEAARTIPQNFGGGQNPTVGINVPASSGVNVGSGSSLNLRGLGSDATLTLINGRRLSYSASRQSIDLSAIPSGIVDRIEIVADGSSAIYGSDAVAGVANIVWRRDMEGLETTVRIGGSTDGGNDQRTYGATGGMRWEGGGGVLAYEYGSNSAIVGSQRSYTRDTGARGLDLLPEIERHSAAVSLHQRFGGISASIDALYNNRRSLMVYALNAAGDRNGLHIEVPTRNESFLVAPSLGLELGQGWRAELSASYGEDRGRYGTRTFTGSTQIRSFDGCYCNDLRAAELSADGPVIDLPGGAARVALGAGYRDVGFVSFRGANSPQNIDAHQRSVYAFGEASLPLLARRDGGTLLRTTAALRYERYPDLGDVATPKLGLVVSPSADLDIKASWGHSFRAPNLLQRYETRFVAVAPVAQVGGTGFPGGATALVVSGGRPDLRPERARSWSATLDLHPRAVPGVRLEVSYFHTHYRDRIVAPIGFESQALSNPIYADQITLSPSLDLVEDTVAGAGQFFDLTGGAYDPARVVAIVDNASVNAAIQRLSGVDAAFTFAQRLGSGDERLSASLAATYLTSSQQLTPAQPEIARAGRLFNPPHFRMRGVLGWSSGLIGLTGAFDRIGGVIDPRGAVPVEVPGMTTFDLTARLRSPANAGLARGLDAVLTLQNMFNAKPARVASTLPYTNPYDSTNYSPIGRFVAISVSKTW